MNRGQDGRRAGARERAQLRFCAREFWFSFTLPRLGNRRDFRRSTWMKVWCVKTKMVNRKVIDSEGVAANVNLVNQNR